MSKIEPIWKVLPHPDHQTSEVITRKMTAEERQKYGIESKGDIKMKTKITVEEMLDYAMKNGTPQLHKYLMNEKGMTSKTASNEIYKNKIREKLKELVINKNISVDSVDILKDSGIETIETKPVYKSPKPKVLMSQELIDLEYHLLENELIIIDTSKHEHESLTIAWDDLELFLSDINKVRAVE